MFRPAFYWMLAALLVSLPLGGSALASDGVLEINQTCAVQAGCFAGDTAGFPVTIDGSAGRSYRLTGDLDLSLLPGTHGIVVSAPHVTLDLGGFEIAGAATCSGSGPTLSCSGALAHGIELSNGDGATVRNGTVRNMGGNGVGGLPDFVRIQGITAIHNGNDGISGQKGSIVLDSHSRENQDDGFDFDEGTVINNCTATGNGNDGFEGDGPGVVVTNTTSTGNGGSGFRLGAESKFGKNVSRSNSLRDVCGGGICSERRRYYLTQTSGDGATPLSACATGFHMASLIEILDGSNLTYDTALGVTSDDSGEGPPSIAAGWIRTGWFGDSSSVPGMGNCAEWSSGSLENFGTGAFFRTDWTFPGESRTPWAAGTQFCSTPAGAWCIEDE